MEVRDIGRMEWKKGNRLVWRIDIGKMEEIKRREEVKRGIDKSIIL
jgi:hypothetical protein